MNLYLVKKYAKGLIDSVGIQSIYNSINTLEILSLCFANKKFISIINSPLISKQIKEELLLSMLEKNDTQTVNLIKLLNNNNRLHIIPNIYNYIKRYVDIVNGKYELIIYSSFKLDDKDIEAIDSIVSNKLGISLYIVTKYSDKEGIKVFINDLFMEVSFFRYQLDKIIKNHIIKPFK